MTSSTVTTANPRPLARLIETLRGAIIGQESLIERLCISLLTDGHLLLEGVPGLAKTRILMALAESIGGTMRRIQFTPDLLPSDIVGTEVYRPQAGEFIVRKGPLFANIVLTDEINRAPAKVQSALLQAMQERAVTIGEETFRLPEPFLVLATQNPIEQEGTYPLPEAELDRFLMKVIVQYPKPAEEVQILERADELSARGSVISKPVLSLSELTAARQALRHVHVAPALNGYIVALVQATREPARCGLSGSIQWGASPRGSLSLRAAARALAFLRGQAQATPDDVKAVAHDVLRHRIVLSYESLGRGTSPDDVINTILKATPVP